MTIYEQAFTAFCNDDGNTLSGVETVAALVLSKALDIVEMTAEDAPDPLDDGGTRDGWNLACKAIEKRLRKIMEPKP